MHMHVYNSTCMCDDLYQACTFECLLRQNDRCYRDQNLDVSRYY